MSVIKFSEAHDLTEAQIDTERRQIHGVVLIKAGMSKNKRDYPAIMLEQAVKVFEGSKAYDNHQQGPRSIRDIAGWYSDVRYEGGKLTATRHFTKTAAGNDAWAIAEAIMNGEAPKNLAGLSINAVGTAKKHPTVEGAVEIESITAAVSVDDVSEAAAGGGYRESANDDLTTAFYEAMGFEEWRDARPDYLERMKKSWQDIKRTDEHAAVLAENKRLKSEIEGLEEFRAAKADTVKLQSDLTEAQEALQAKRSEHDTALAELANVRRELAIERALQQVSLPAQWSKDLRESLLKAPEGEWASIIEREKAKAKSAGLRIHVSGAGQQVNAPLKEAEKSAEVSGRDLLPKPNEKVEDWQKRMASIGR